MIFWFWSGTSRKAAVSAVTARTMEARCSAGPRTSCKHSRLWAQGAGVGRFETAAAEGEVVVHRPPSIRSAGFPEPPLASRLSAPHPDPHGAGPGQPLGSEKKRSAIRYDVRPAAKHSKTHLRAERAR
jgi:hypothetical protein